MNNEWPGHRPFSNSSALTKIRCDWQPNDATLAVGMSDGLVSIQHRKLDVQRGAAPERPRHKKASYKYSLKQHVPSKVRPSKRIFIFWETFIFLTQTFSNTKASPCLLSCGQKDSEEELIPIERCDEFIEFVHVLFSGRLCC